MARIVFSLGARDKMPGGRVLKAEEYPMKQLFLTLSLAVLSLPAATWAVTPPPNAAGVSNGHLHLNVRDVDANTKFLVAMGGAATKAGGRGSAMSPDKP